MRLLRPFVAIAALAVLIGCSGRPDLDAEKLSSAEFNLEEFFEGRSTAYGQFQDILGNVSRRFKVEITGEWDGKILTLVEDFVYEDNTTEQRIWTLTKTGDQTWQGSAPGVLGIAQGRESGDTFNWKYRIDLPIPDGTMRVSFDDWMWLLDDGRVLNRAYVMKYGITIGEVIIFFEKE